ncbi:TIP41-domain-containing protein [Atractiella rhizophila]|nr:TIP41-domain-containing protein [Atractiella rhizophila]
MATNLKQPEVVEDGAVRSILVNGWKIETRKKPISNSAQLEEISKTVPVNLPEIVFGENYLRISNEQFGFEYEIEGLEALREVEVGEGTGIKVAYADEWERGRSNPANATPESQAAVVQKPYDWTYSTCYPGRCSPSSSNFTPPPPSHPGIPLASLTVPEPIFFYDDVPFFEDELGDNGTSYFSVKIRVMPSCFFILARFFLRVDQVLFRIFDTRIYHKFGTEEVIREQRGREAAYKRVKAHLESPADLSNLTNANWVANVLGMLEQTGSKPTQASSITAPSFPKPPNVPSPSVAPTTAFSRPQRTPMVPPPPSQAQSQVPALTQAVKEMRVAEQKIWKGVQTTLDVCTLESKGGGN